MFKRAKVISTIDPLNKGRIKIFIYGIYPDSYEDVPDKLPWAEPAMNIFGGYTSANGSTNAETGSCGVPKKGSTVWVFFDGGDINYPVYFAVSQSGDGWTPTHENQRVIQTENVRIVIDEVPEAHTNQFKVYGIYEDETEELLTAVDTEEKADEYVLTVDSTIYPETRIEEVVYTGKDRTVVRNKTKSPLEDNVDEKLYNNTRLDIEIEATNQTAINLKITGNVNIEVIGDTYKKTTGNIYEVHIGDKYIRHEGNLVIDQVGSMDTKIEGSVYNTTVGDYTRKTTDSSLVYVGGYSRHTVKSTHTLTTGSSFRVASPNTEVLGIFEVAIGDTGVISTGSTVFVNKGIVTTIV